MPALTDLSVFTKVATDFSESALPSINGLTSATFSISGHTYKCNFALHGNEEHGLKIGRKLSFFEGIRELFSQSFSDKLVAQQKEDIQQLRDCYSRFVKAQALAELAAEMLCPIDQLLPAELFDVPRDGFFASTPAVDLSRSNDDDAPPIKRFIPSEPKARQVFQVVTGSTWRSNQFYGKKASADSFVCSFHSITGLPVAVTLDGASRFAEHDVVTVIGKFVGAALDKILLEVHERPQSDIKQLVRERYRDLQDNLRFIFGSEAIFESEASFSAVALYRDGSGHLMSVGFSTGDTMVVHDDGEEVKPYLAARAVWDRVTASATPLTLPAPEIKGGVERSLVSLQVETRFVQPRDRFIFMTHGAFEDGPLQTQRQLTELTAESTTGSYAGRFTVLDVNLAPDALAPGENVEKIARQVQAQVNDNFFAAAANGDATYGDDITVVSMMVPS